MQKQREEGADEEEAFPLQKGKVSFPLLRLLSKNCSHCTPNPPSLLLLPSNSLGLGHRDLARISPPLPWP